MVTPRCQESRLILSEPLRHLPGIWNGAPESSCGIVSPGQDEVRAFKPLAPSHPTVVLAVA